MLDVGWNLHHEIRIIFFLLRAVWDVLRTYERRHIMALSDGDKKGVRLTLLLGVSRSWYRLWKPEFELIVCYRAYYDSRNENGRKRCLEPLIPATFVCWRNVTHSPLLADNSCFIVLVCTAQDHQCCVQPLRDTIRDTRNRSILQLLTR